MPKTREQLFFTIGAVGLVIVLAIIGGVVYLAYKVEVGTLRAWAIGATLALPLALLVAFYLGRLEARGHIAGLSQGIEAVTGATARTVDAAGRVADVRVATAQRMRNRQATPAVQQVFLPGLPGGGMGGSLILPPQHTEEDVEL